MLADVAGGGAIACCLVKSCPAGNLPFADLTQATTFIDFAPCTIIILPCVATAKGAREARAVAELRGILQQEASLLDKRGLSVWRIRQDALTVIGKMSILGFRLAEFGVNAVDGVHTWNLVCHDESMAVPSPVNHRQQQQQHQMAEQHTPVRDTNAMYDNKNHQNKAEPVHNFTEVRATANTFDLSSETDNREPTNMSSQQDNFLSTSYAESTPRGRGHTNNLNILGSTSAGTSGASRFSSSSNSARSTRTAQAALSGAAFGETQQSGRLSGNVSTSSLNDSTGMQYDSPNSNLLISRRGAPTMLAPAPFSRPKIVNQQHLMTGGSVHTNNIDATGVGASAIRRMSSGSMPTMASSSSGIGGVAKKASKKRKKKSLGLGRSKSRKRIPSNFGPLHPRTAALLETRRSNLVPEELKAEQHDELIPLLERVQVFLTANPQLGLRPRWRLLQPIGHPHCTAHFKCTTHIKGAPIMCPARIAVGLDRVTRRYHITYEMISHECQQLLGNNTNAAGIEEEGDEEEHDDTMLSGAAARHEGDDMEATGNAEDDFDDEDADDNDGGNIDAGDNASSRQNTLSAADENDLSGNMSIKIDEAHNEMMMNDDRAESPWTMSTPTVSFAAKDEARE